MNKWLILLLFLISINLVSATCSENQINVNTATLEELDEIYGIGPAKAQAIIDSRPYETIDDLTKAYGIGSVTLENIKSEGLACVEENNLPEENEKIGQNDEKLNEETSYEYLEKNEVSYNNNSSKEELSSTTELLEKEISLSQNQNTLETETKNKILKEEIHLNPEPPKNIKTSENSKLEEDRKYSIYALVIFCIFLGGLFLFEKRKNNNKNKNEFRNNKD